MEIIIYGEIAEGLAASVRQQLASAKGPVRLRISSPGGSLSEGLAIHSLLSQYGPGVDVVIDGFALSAGSVIAMAGRTIKAVPSAVIMIHDAWSSASGNASDMQRAAAGLDHASDAMATIYAKRTRKPADEIRGLLKAETWFNAEEALAFGLIDEILDADMGDFAAMAASFDLSRYTIPERFQAMTTPTINAADILAKEANRVKEIRDIFGSHGPEHLALMVDCISDQTIDAAAAGKKLLAMLAKDVTPTAGAYRFTETDRVPDFAAAASDALLMRAGIRLEKPHAGAKDIARMSLVAMAESCISMRGGTIPDRSAAGIFKQAFRAAHTTSDFPMLLANAANKSLMKGYNDEPATFKGWTRETDVADFKTLTRLSRSEAPTMDAIVEGGEVTFGSFSERREQYALSTYARGFTCTRQMLVNDDLSAFTELPHAFGQSARRKENDVVFGILTANAAMSDSVALFHATHNNLASTGASITLAALSAARAAMRLQKGIGGLQVLNLTPRYLIVPAALETIAEEIIASTAKPEQDNPGVGSNKFIRSLELVVEPRLDAADATEWYLSASADQVDTIEIARLSGNRGVQVDEEFDFNTGNFKLKAVMDFAAKAIDWRGLYKTT